MVKQAKLKCLRCGFEYSAPREAAEKEERTCPHCRSNSIRILPDEKSGSD